MSLRISFDGLRIAPGSIHSKEEFSNRPAIDLPLPPENTLYTILMYDLDAPYPSPNDKNSPFLHWLVTNIPSSSFPSGEELVPYLAPNPPADSVPHRYLIRVFAQGSGRIVLPPDRAPINRARFPISDFIKQFGLVAVTQMWFLSSAQ